MTAIAARLERAHPATNTGVAITVRPLLDKVVSGIRGTLLALIAMVTSSCSSPAPTSRARCWHAPPGGSRTSAVRLALGASPGGSSGTADREPAPGLRRRRCRPRAGRPGCEVADRVAAGRQPAAPAGRRLRPQRLRRDSRGDARAGVITGLVPALQVVRPNLVAALQDGARGSTDGARRKRPAQPAGRRRSGARAGAAGRRRADGSDDAGAERGRSGFRVDHLAVAGCLARRHAARRAGARAAMYERVRERLRVLPGVTSVSAINHLPLAGDVWTLGYTMEGRPAPEPGSPLGRGLSRGRPRLLCDVRSAADRRPGLLDG